MLLLTFVFFQQAKALGFWFLNLVNDVVEFCKIDLILVPDDLTLGLGLQTHLDDIPRLVVEQTM